MLINNQSIKSFTQTILHSNAICMHDLIGYYSAQNSQSKSRN